MEHINIGNILVLTVKKSWKVDSLLKFLQNAFPDQSIKCKTRQDLIDPEDCEFIFSTWSMPAFSEEEIEKFFPNLKAVFYVGGSVRKFGRAFLKKGVKIFSATEINAVSVAEFTIAQVLLANKGYFTLADAMRTPITRKKKEELKADAGKYKGNVKSVLGIVGLGNIGRKVAELAGNFDLKLIACDPFVANEVFERFNVEKVSLEELFSRSDVVTCHLPNLKSTQNMIDRRLFELMKPFSTFINTGRGAQVNEKDLCKVLRKRKDLTALLDITKDEPPKLFSPLYYLKNVILSPHIAGGHTSHGEFLRMIEFSFDNFKNYLKGEPTKGEITLKILEAQT